jgi:hypothetical protein
MAQTTKDEAAKGPRFRIRTRVRDFTRRKHPPFNGIQFVNGEGFTDSKELAEHFLTECQCEVTDTHSGKVHNPLPDTIAAEEGAAADEKSGKKGEGAKK